MRHNIGGTLMYKVPFRECYTPSLRAWAKWAIWCHVILPVWKDHIV